MSKTFEKTQFSMVELTRFLDEKREPRDPRERYMRQFADLPGAPEYVTKYGGLDNIQRVRVLSNAESVITFEPVTKLPPALVAEKRAREEREAKKKAVLAEVERLKKDPDALRKYVHEVAFALLGRMALALLDSGKKPSKKPAARRPAPKKKVTPYDLAVQQDQRNRREAAKKAAEEFRAKQQKATA
jgi:hypothetical protein